MEKLKVKHDHTLTDIIKVGIFAIFLLLPLFVFAPTAFYYGFNEHAVVNSEQVEIIEHKKVNFNQYIHNGKPTSITDYIGHNASLSFNSGYIYVDNIESPTNFGIRYIYDLGNVDFLGHEVLISFEGYTINDDEILNARIRYPFTSDLFQVSNNLTKIQLKGTFTEPLNNTAYLLIQGRVAEVPFAICHLQLFDLTQMFGSGNEPTIQEFNTYFTESYYNFNNGQDIYIDIPTGTYKDVTDITSNINYAWEQLWQQPLLYWTGNNNFAFTINAMSNIFGISQNSYIANYINYLLTLTAIYVIFDIVLAVFVKLTHMLHE